MGHPLKRVLAASVLLASAAAYAQDAPPPGIAPVTLGTEPYVFDTAEQHKIKVSVLAKGLQRPFGIEFLPSGDLLISERGMANEATLLEGRLVQVRLLHLLRLRTVAGQANVDWIRLLESR